MDFDAGPTDVFVATKLIYVATKFIYVATLQLTCVFRLYCGFVATFMTLILLSLCRDKVYECRDISKASMS